MSEKHMEDLRRICLICGCHTSQIINVFEPRNGPNIVELIRAKFKFQPVSDDKYLCYTCNNWLINWHSLRNLNKDSVEDHPENSRCRVNDSMPEESDPISNTTITNRNQNPEQGESALHANLQQYKKRNGFYFPKRPAPATFRIGKIKEKYQSCPQCGRRLRKRSDRMSHMQKATRNKTCKYCSRANQDSHRLKTSVWRRCWGSPYAPKPTSLVERSCNLVSFSRSQSPVVDSKLVAKLQRLGTTLIWESDMDSDRSFTPYASRTGVSHMKPDTRRRINKRNEVVIDFNQALSEVLPLEYTSSHLNLEKSPQVISNLTNRATDMLAMTKHAMLEEFCFKLPEEITISLVESERLIN